VGKSRGHAVPEDNSAISHGIKAENLWGQDFPDNRGIYLQAKVQKSGRSEVFQRNMKDCQKLKVLVTRRSDVFQNFLRNAWRKLWKISEITQKRAKKCHLAKCLENRRVDILKERKLRGE